MSVELDFIVSDTFGLTETQKEVINSHRKRLFVILDEIRQDPCWSVFCQAENVIITQPLAHNDSLNWRYRQTADTFSKVAECVLDYGGLTQDEFRALDRPVRMGLMKEAAELLEGFGCKKMQVRRPGGVFSAIQLSHMPLEPWKLMYQ